MLNFCDFIQVYVFGTNHHLKRCISDVHCPVTGTTQGQYSCVTDAIF